jgi:lipid-binding SYLF domain-containing protein
MQKIFMMLAICASAVALWFAEKAVGQVVVQTPETQIVNSATSALQDIMAIPAKQIPQSLLSHARGVAIVPNVVKGGFVVGVRRGHGVLLIRDDQGQWQPPLFITLTGGSIGWQAGIQATDVILVFRTRNSIANLMNENLTIGVDAAASAGPVGRNVAASTDPTLRAEILSYSRSRGLFAGASIDGSVIAVDYAAGASYYGNRGNTVTGQPPSLPHSAVQLINQLVQYSGGWQTVAGPAPPAQQAPVNRIARPDPESTRQQLAVSYTGLQRLLDAQWKAHLRLPPALVAGDQPLRVEELRQALKRYETVAADARYAALTRRTEFASTLRLLREYVTSIAEKSASTLNLPPPPTATR